MTTFSAWLTKLLGGRNWYVNDRPIKRRDDAGDARIKLSDFRAFEVAYARAVPDSDEAGRLVEKGIYRAWSFLTTEERRDLVARFVKD